MFNNDCNEIIRPLLIEEKRRPSEVRRHCRLLSKELISRIRPLIPKDSNALFVFVLRGAMLLYPPFAEEFEEASFCFISAGSRTKLDLPAYDAVVIVDTVIETGKTVRGAKKLLEDTGISTDNWIVAAVCANRSSQKSLLESFDKVFCIEFMDNVRVTVDAGEFAMCGDNAQAEWR